jgi:hypothetical protein
MISATLFAADEALEEALLGEWTAVRGADDSWVGVALRPVVESAFAAPELRALFPFISMNRLCFSRCTQFPFTDDCPLTFKSNVTADEDDLIITVYYEAAPRRR